MRYYLQGRLSFLSYISLIFIVPLLCCFALPAFSQTDVIDPGPTLIGEGIPKIPASLALSVKWYTSAYGLPLAGWNPTKHEVWLKDLANKTTILSRVDLPGADRQALSIIPIGGVYDLYFYSSGNYIVYDKD